MTADTSRAGPAAPAGAAPGDLEALLEDIAAQVRPPAQSDDGDGCEPASGVACPDSFTLATCDLDGAGHATGDVDVRFPIQSVAKVFARTWPCSRSGRSCSSGSARNPPGTVQFPGPARARARIPRNPMINAGALVVCDVLLDAHPDPRAAMGDLLSSLAGEDVSHDEAVLEAEGTGHRNTAMAHLMSAFGNLHHPVPEVMAAYVHQCAITMTATQLARSVRFLAAAGIDPGIGEQVVTEALARRINAIMLTTGTYDSAGQFDYEVGIPCKSGVSGAIVGVVPGRLGVCAWSPPLDDSGNSRAGRAALHLLTEHQGWSIF